VPSGKRCSWGLFVDNLSPAVFAGSGYAGWHRRACHPRRARHCQCGPGRDRRDAIPSDTLVSAGCKGLSGQARRGPVQARAHRTAALRGRRHRLRAGEVPVGRHREEGTEAAATARASTCSRLWSAGNSCLPAPPFIPCSKTPRMLGLSPVFAAGWTPWIGRGASEDSTPGGGL
jgi:hypothetical protein